jgi:hypothetical protein
MSKSKNEDINPEVVAEEVAVEEVVEATAAEETVAEAPVVEAPVVVEEPVKEVAAPAKPEVKVEKTVAPAKGDTVAIYSSRSVLWPGVGNVVRGYNIVSAEAAKLWLKRNHTRVATPEEVAKEYGN